MAPDCHHPANDRRDSNAHRHSPFAPSESAFAPFSLFRSVRTLMPSNSAARVRLPFDTSSARSMSFASASSTLSDVSTTAPSGAASVAAAAIPGAPAAPDDAMAYSPETRIGVGPVHAPL